MGLETFKRIWSDGMSSYTWRIFSPFITDIEVQVKLSRRGSFNKTLLVAAVFLSPHQQQGLKQKWAEIVVAEDWKPMKHYNRQ